MLLTIDTGGTKTLMAISGSDGEFTDMIKFDTPADPDEYLARVKFEIDERFSTGVTAVVVAVPGLVEENRVKWCANLPWRDFDIATALREKFNKDIPVKLQNDANLAALGAVHALETLPHVGLYLTFSTGVGAGVIVDGRISAALNDIEAGHIMLKNTDGQYVEWESFASGRAFYRQYQKFGDEIVDPDIWRDFATKVAEGLLVLIPVIQPDVIVVGGSMGAHFVKFGDFVREIVDQELPEYLRRPQIVQAASPEHAVLYGERIYAEQAN